MIMCTLLSMICGLIKPCWLSHVKCTCFKETAILFNLHLSCLVDFMPCSADKYMFKVNNKKNRFICMCSELKTNTAWHRSGVFIVDFDHSQDINIVFLQCFKNTKNDNVLKTHNVLKTQKTIYLFCYKSWKAYFI